MEGIRRAFVHSVAWEQAQRHPHPLDIVISQLKIERERNKPSAASRFALNFDLRGLVYRVFSFV